MSDLISREAVLKRAETSTFTDKNEKRKFMDWLNYCLEAPIEPQWIPCSERLPTEKEAWDYNVEDVLYEPNEFIVQVKGAKLPTIAMFDGETFTHRYAEDGYGFMDEIIAWMPLPEPYKALQT